MDKAGLGLYFSAMLRAMTLILTAFLFAVVAFTASAHETGMAVSREFGSSMPHMEHAAPMKAACADDAGCKTDTGLCYFVCMGAGVFLLPERISTQRLALREDYRLQPERAFVAVSPARVHRPPIAYVL